MDTAGMTREAGCWLLLEPGRDVPSFVNIFAQYTEGYREKVFESLVQWVAGALLEVGGGERALAGLLADLPSGWGREPAVMGALLRAGVDHLAVSSQNSASPVLDVVQRENPNIATCRSSRESLYATVNLPRPTQIPFMAVWAAMRNSHLGMLVRALQAGLESSPQRSGAPSALCALACRMIKIDIEALVFRPESPCSVVLRGLGARGGSKHEEIDSLSKGLLQRVSSDLPAQQCLWTQESDCGLPSMPACALVPPEAWRFACTCHHSFEHRTATRRGSPWWHLESLHTHRVCREFCHKHPRLSYLLCSHFQPPSHDPVLQHSEGDDAREGPAKKKIRTARPRKADHDRLSELVRQGNLREARQLLEQLEGSQAAKSS